MALTRVRYMGLSDVREMSKADLEAAGVFLDSGLRWEAKNRGSGILVQDPSDRLLEIFETEGVFMVTRVEEGGEEVIVHGRTLDDTATVVKDATNGQVSERGGASSEQDPAEIVKAAEPAENSTTVETGPPAAKGKTKK